MLLGRLAESFDDLKAVAIDAIRPYIAQIKDTLLDREQDFDLIIAGISDSTGPEVWLMSSHNGFVKPWVISNLSGLAEFAEARGLVMLPSDREMYPEISAVLDGRSVDDLDPVADGIRLVEIQRARWPGPAHTVPSGFLQLASVTDSAISTRIIHRWPGDETAAGPRP